jgi:glyoxylase-like metal-dependent hydrolase (beta-lactamase superfamily II)
MGFKTALPTHLFADGHVFDFGAVKLTAIHTPGHSSDHMCLFEPMRGVLLAFDIDLTSFGPWYAHRESDIGAFEASMQKVIALQPRVVVSSHKGVITDDVPARLQRYADVFAERDRILLALLPRARTVDALLELSPFYRGYPYADKLLRYWEGMMIRKHLARLVERGEVVEGEGEYGKRKA